MKKNRFRYFKTSSEIIQLAIMTYVLFPLSIRNVENLLRERGIDIRHESVRLWVDRFGTMFAPQSMPRSTIISTEKDTSTAAQFSKLTDPKRFRNGATLREWLAEKSCLSGN